MTDSLQHMAIRSASYAPRRGTRRPSTAYLFVWPKLVDGVASVLDVFGSRWPYNYSQSETEADARALRCDWAVTAQDLFDAIESFRFARSVESVEKADDEETELTTTSAKT